MANARTIETVERERERERELHFYQKWLLLGNLTNTSNFIQTNKGRNTFYIDMQKNRL